MSEQTPSAHRSGPADRGTSWFRRFFAIFMARNKEFYRDRATLGWNLLFPVFILFGMAIIFSDERQAVFEIGVLGSAPVATDEIDEIEEVGEVAEVGELEISGPAPFFELENVNFIVLDEDPSDPRDALLRLEQHRLDLLVDVEGRSYWVNELSGKGQLAERLLLASDDGARYSRRTVDGRQIRYIDWLIPGLLSMNVMFSCLFGVGFVLVRYRKNGVLRRLKATPLSAVEFLTAQVASRLVLILGTTTVVYVGSDWILDFVMVGSHALLLLIFALGSFCLIAMGLVLAARTASEELANGLLNLVTFPMIFLSGVWFSIDDAPRWVHWIAQALPLTHVNDAARLVMTDGAGIAQIAPNLLALVAMSVVFLLLGASLFRWE